MNAREREVAALTFGAVDRLPFSPGSPRESTLARWRTEGLPESVSWFSAVCGELGIREEPRVSAAVDADFRMIPWFEEKVLSHENGHYIVRDWMGAVTEISDRYDYTYIRNAKDFVTRKWHSFPVKNRADFEAMRLRFDPADPARLPQDFDGRARLTHTATATVTLRINGPFWQLREFTGMENLCMLFLDDPALVRDMCLFWKDFVSAMLRRVLPLARVDCVHFSEDMAYKAHPMISPAMTREFLKPCYDEWTELLRGANVPLIDMDSDGYIDDLLPIWIESGFNVCDPMEVAAHNDIVASRRKYGRSVGYRGGFDKRCIAAGRAEIDAELRRILPVIESGGYIPGCDHGVPHDISWENFLYYCRLLAKATGWLA